MFTRATLNEYVEKGLISVQTHQKSDEVCIYNYTQACQYSGAWDEVTTKCRGLIIDWRETNMDGIGRLLSNPLPKFFNYEEHVQKGRELPTTMPRIYEKLDGWLGILYWLDGEPWIATRGSFGSTGAVWATEWFRTNVDWEKIEDRDWTHLFEIISPITKIVCNYDFEGLVWLTARHLRYTEVDIAAMPEYNCAPLILRDGTTFTVTTAKEIPHADYETLKGQNSKNEEGFVLVYPDGFRLKIKFEEYARLHKIITGVSAIGIWEMMRDGQPIDFENVPDEFFKWVEETQEKIRSDFHAIFSKAMDAKSEAETLPTRKEQAIWVMQHAKDVSGIVFSFLDGENKKGIAQIYKMIRPHGQSVFKKDDL